jgi:hypothetical protein
VEVEVEEDSWVVEWRPKVMEVGGDDDDDEDDDETDNFL